MAQRQRDNAADAAAGGPTGWGQQQSARDRIWTVPNLLSLLRLAGVPLFLWLLLGAHANQLAADGYALLVMVVSGITDWLDGKLARWLNQQSRFGEMLDPLADRLYTLATLVAFVIRDFIPWWVAAALIARDLVMAVTLLVLRRRGFAPPEVNYLGKAATFVLMYAFPLLLLTEGHSTAAALARPIAYAFMVWGGSLFLWSGALYVLQAVWTLRGREFRRSRPDRAESA